MKTIVITDRSSASDLLPQAQEEVLIVRNGHPVALVTPFDDDDLEWYAREHDPAFIESIRQAREQVRRGETVAGDELDNLFADEVDGLDLSNFSPPASVGTLQRTKCSTVPPAPGVYVVLRPSRGAPVFLEKSVGGWFKGEDPSVPADVLRTHWNKDATVLYIGKGDGRDGLKRRLGDLMGFGRGKRIGHRGGRYIWQLRNHQQLFVRWKTTPDGNPSEIKSHLIAQFRAIRGRRPFANLNK